MTDQPAQPAPVKSIPKVEELFKHIPHPRIAERKHEKPVKVDDERVGVNGKVALIITSVVGTMWAAYVFAVIGVTGIAAAVTNSVTVVLIVGRGVWVLPPVGPAADHHRRPEHPGQGR